VDAREQLRRYLEQRRELGETELVLDGLSVEEVLKILGAAAGGTGARAPRARAVAPIERAVETPREREGDVAPPADWRDALRASGAAPSLSEPSAETRASTPADEPPRTREKAMPTSEPPAPAATRTSASAEPGADNVERVALPGIIVGGGAAREKFGAITGHLESLGDIANTVKGCTRCPLYATATNPVPGEGNSDADLVVVGEAPGATEDETGRPFVGAAGQLLTKILGAIQLTREEVFICNVLKHRPPGNRNPRPEEVAACSPYLVRQIELIRPKVLLALGTFAAQTLLETKLSIGKLRGQIHQYYGVPLVVTYHPAALLRNPSWKRPTWEDVQLARRILDRARAGA
jgi:uracil-DNA glycosylase family 4